MKIEIPVSDELLHKLNILSEQLGSNLEQTSTLVMKSGISHLLNQHCAICGQSITQSFVSCDSCSLLVDCGYLHLQFENFWKGDRWLVDPSITCYSCLIINELEENLEAFVDTSSEEQIWGLKERMPEIIKEITNESIRTTGDGETQVMSFPIKTEKVEPKTWKILDAKVDRFLIQILNSGT